MNSSVFAGDPGLQSGEEGEKKGLRLRRIPPIRLRRRMNPAKLNVKSPEGRQNNLAKTGHIQVYTGFSPWAP
jgi:hypothetical protein